MIKKILIDGQIEEVVIPVDVFKLGEPAEAGVDEWSTNVNCGRFVKECASYDPEDHWCMEKDSECFQDGVKHCVCLYYKNYVLPGIEQEQAQTKRVLCKGCAVLFSKPGNSKATLCPECRKRRNRERSAVCMRNKRNVNKNKPEKDI